MIRKNKLKNLINSSILSLLLLIGLLFSIKSCIEPPEFDFVPEISFNNVKYYNITETDPTGTDTLIVSINFQDGDGDLGLRANDTMPPFHAFDYVTNDQGSRVTYADVNRNPVFNNFNYVIDSVLRNNVKTVDTFLIERNENFYNIIIRFQAKRSGQWTDLNLEGPPYYTTFNGRFPLLNSESYARPIEGVLSYKMNSAGFRVILRNDSVRFEVKIKDRALNNSNTIITPAFTLPQVTVTD